MTLRELLDQWHNVGIRLWEDDGQLRYRAPRGTVTDDVLAQLRTRKDDILKHLRTRTGPQPRPDERFEPFPLTDVQGAYLMGRSGVFDYGGVACHLYCEVGYPRLDPDRALAAWRALVDRHDMLRVEIDASGFQRVRPQVPPLEMPVTGVTPSERIAHLNRVRERLSHSVHPAGTWPMFAVELTQIADDSAEARSTMHISFDFLVGDWASLLSLIREWEQEYAGQAAPSRSLLQFRDYVVWDLEQRESQTHRRARDYWLRRIESLPPAPQLPVRHETVVADAPARWHGHSYLLPQAQWRSLEAHARDHGLTASVAVLACYADVLSRWAQDPHFCLNLTVLDRPSDVPGLAGVVGDFTSVTLLETRADTRPFDGRAREMLEQLFTDLDHRSFSGVEVMREIARRRGRDAAVMPYVFTSAIGVGGGGTAAPVRGSMDYTISQTPQAFLDCQVMDDQDGLHVHWDAREGIIPDEMLTSMFTAFTEALRSLADDADSWSLASPVELPPHQRRQREQANATQRRLPTGMLHEFALRAARATPTASAILGRGVAITYEDLLRLSGAVADALASAGVRRGDRVAIAIPKSPNQVAAVLGVLIVGAAYVPLDVRNPHARLAAICVDAGISALVHADGHRITDDVPGVDMDALSAPTGDEDLPGVASDTHPGDLAYVIYTSGSTGRPKGVDISHRAVVNTIMDVNERFRLARDDRTLAIADLSFDLSVYDIFGPLSVGAAIVIPPDDTVVTPSTWLELAAEHGVTIMNTVPAVARLLLTSMRNGAPHPESIRQWILSGDRVPRELVHDLRAALPGTQFVAMGGATEAAIWSIAHPIASDEPRRGSVAYGRPLANQQFAIVDQFGRDAPTGVPGEIVIMGAGLADGYSNDAELTRQRFVDDPHRGRMYRTGDQGLYLPDGEIEILGRFDDQVKIRGHRVELGEIENVLTDHEQVAQAAAVVVGGQTQQRVHAFVVPAVAEDSRLQRWAQESAEEAAAGVDVDDGDGIAAYAAALDAACVATLRHTLAQVDAGLPVSPGNAWIVEEWRRALHGREPTPEDASNPRRVWEHVAQLSPKGFDYRQFTGYVRRCAETLPELLAGRVPPHELLFPGGGQDVAERVYQDRASLRWGNAAVAALVSRIAAAHDAATPLRILEVGAGTGSTTAHIAAGLSDADFRYTFTDRSEYFLRAARERWGHDNRWAFETLDVDRDLAEQGFDERSFDLVCAFGVLENARSIPRALERLARLAAEGGLIMLSEPVDEQWWVYVSQIFLMTEPDRSRRGHGLFPSAQWWVSQLTASAGGGVTVLPGADSVLAPEHLAFFAARVRPDQALTPIESVLPFLTSRLPEVMVPQQIDIVARLPLTRNAKIDKKSLAAKAAADLGDTTVRPDERDVAVEARVSSVPRRAEAMAARIAGLWAEQLDLGHVPGYGSNPFDLGANSISAAAVAGRLRDSAPELEEVSFETILRTLLGSSTIADAATALSLGSSERTAPTPSARPEVVLTTLRERSAASPAPRSRLTVLFGDSLADGRSVVQLAASLPPEAGTIATVTAPDDAWFTGLPANTVTETIADRAAAILKDSAAEEYSLVGYSYGALVAMETARRLLEGGCRVLPLGLVDPHVVPVMADDWLTEVMFLTARGARLDDLADDGQDAPALVEILAWVSQEQASAGAAASAAVERFVSHVTRLEEETRWQAYHAAVPAGRSTSAGALRREWLRYRHTMRAATLTPEPLVADAVIVQPRSSHGFLPGAHENAARTWREVLIGASVLRQADGDHFTMLSGEHLRGAVSSLVEGLTALGAYPPGNRSPVSVLDYRKW